MKRRQFTSPSTLDLALNPSQSTSTPSSSSPRANSPSVFSALLRGPPKWFGRTKTTSKTSESDVPVRQAPPSPRKTKISQPSDARPLLAVPRPSPLASSRSHSDLPSTTEHSRESSSKEWVSSSSNLAAYSRRSRSVDDLSKFAEAEQDPQLVAHITNYRSAANNSNTHAHAPPVPMPRTGRDASMGEFEFPRIITTSQSQSSDAPSSREREPPLPSSSRAMTRQRSFSNGALFNKLSSSSSSPAPHPQQSQSQSHGDIAHGSPSRGTRRGERGERDRDERPRMTHNHSLPNSSSLPRVAENLKSLSPTPTPTSPTSTRGPERSSQIVHSSGFLSQHASPPSSSSHPNPHPNLSLALSSSKGWTARKVVLKGTKLFFYKPPKDRAGEIRDLFPASIADISLELGAEEGMYGGGRQSGMQGFGGRQSGFPLAMGPSIEVTPAPLEPGPEVVVPNTNTNARRRPERMFRGRTRHPQLVVSVESLSESLGGAGGGGGGGGGGKVKGRAVVKQGSLSALLHEMVFATTFFPLGRSSSSPSSSSSSDASPLAENSTQSEWTRFATSIVVSLPSEHLMGQTRFENELFDQVESLLRGLTPSPSASPSDSPSPSSPSPSDPDEDEGLEPAVQRVDTIMSMIDRFWKFEGTRERWGKLRGEIGGSLPALVDGSGRRDTTIVREEEEESMSRIPFPPSASSDQQQISQQSQNTGSGSQKSRPHPQRSNTRDRDEAALTAALASDGFTPDLLLQLPVELIARSLSAANQSKIRSLVNGGSGPGWAKLVFDTLPGPNSPSTSQAWGSTALAPWFGTSTSIHWISRLVFWHIFGSPADPFPPSTSSLSTHQPGPEIVRVSSRAQGRLISAWTEVGEICRLGGDVCSWEAIRSVISAAAVLRVRRAWEEVEEGLREVVGGWGEIDPTVQQRDALTAPWLVRRLATIQKSLSEDLDPANTSVSALLSIGENVERIADDFRACAERPEILEPRLAPLVKEWHRVSSARPHRHFTLDDYLSVSFSIEPKVRSHFSDLFWKPRIESSLPPLAPLDYPRPLPTSTFISPNFLGLVPSDENSVAHISETQFRAVLGMNSSVRGELDGMGMSLLKPDPVVTHGHRADSELADTAFTVFNGELMLKVLRSGPSRRVSRAHDASNRSSHYQSHEGSFGDDHASAIPDREERARVGGGGGLSRAPSVTAAMSGSLNRKPSKASLVSRRSSLPSLSRKPSFIRAAERDPRPQASSSAVIVAVVGGTLDRLIDVLVDGLDVTASTTDDSGLSAFGATRRLEIDQEDLESTWWATFRSFVTPFVFFELLRKRYLLGRSPLTSTEDASNTNLSEFRLRIMRVFRQWLIAGEGAQDIFDDSELAEACRKFFGQVEKQAAKEAHDADSRSLSAISAELRKLLDRPPVSALQRSSRILPRKDLGAHSPNIDTASPASLVDELEAIAESVMSRISTADFLATADIVEVQLLDRGLCPSEDGFEETLYTLLSRLDPGPSAAPFCAPGKLPKSLPSSIKRAFSAHAAIRNWAVFKIAELGINAKKREARVRLLCDVVELLRSRSLGPNRPHRDETTKTPILLTPTIPSFVETAVVSALWSPESRLYAHIWGNVVSELRYSSLDSMEMLFAQTTSVAPSNQSCHIDLGWILEQALCILALPDTLVRNEQMLVNFDKRRFLSKLGNNFFPAVPRVASEFESDTRRLNHMVQEYRHVIDGLYQAAKDEISFEAAYNASMRRFPRPFQNLVAAQNEKNRRDRSYRERLAKERRQEQQKFDRREQDINRAMNPHKMVVAPAKHQRNKRSIGGVSLLMRAVRPISTAWGSERTTTSRQRTASELDFVPAGKPSLVLSLNDAQVNAFESGERPFVFQLITEDGGRWLLQAPTVRELHNWVQTIGVASRKRSTYLPNAPKPPQAEPLVPVGSGAVFGVRLDVLVENENTGEYDVRSVVPRALEQCLSEIERRGLGEPGLYRIPGSVSDVALIRQIYNEGRTPDLAADSRFGDTNAICGVVKTFLRQLPEPVIPIRQFRQAMSAARITDYAERLEQLRDLVHSLPPVHFATLYRLLQHFDKITDYEETNQMHAENLAVCVAPSLIRGPDTLGSLAHIGPSVLFVKHMILSFHRIFDAEPDNEVDAEPDNESEPIGFLGTGKHITVVVEEDEPSES